MPARPLPHAMPAFSNLPLLRRLGVLARDIARWGQRHRSRQALARLDHHRLRDIGLTAEDVARETAKAFWRD